jgi:hypothetical protein
MSQVKTNGTMRAYTFTAIFTEEFYFLRWMGLTNWLLKCRLMCFI